MMDGLLNKPDDRKKYQNMVYKISLFCKNMDDMMHDDMMMYKRKGTSKSNRGIILGLGRYNLLNVFL
jgi:hypothetical protein